MSQAFAATKLGILALLAAVTMAFAPQAAMAQVAADEVSETAVEEAQEGSDPLIEPAADVEGLAETAPQAEGAYTPMAPTPGKGMPEQAGLTFQDQYTEDGRYALWMHDYMLLPIITIISLFVLALLLWVVVRYSRRANPQPSKTTHNTLIEVVWTIVPVVILVVIAVPSLTLLARQYETPPADAVTIKAVGYQWYWGYEYPDHDVEIISNMLDENAALTSGEPHQLAVDNRMVVPVGVPLRIQTTAADVIHSFAVPALWFKQDAVPGRLNERILQIDEPGVYYGQCSELCGALHGYMPIAVEAVPMEQFEAWVASQGGSMPGAEEAAAEAPAAEAADEAATEAEAG